MARGRARAALQPGTFDVVITNPPFGPKIKVTGGQEGKEGTQAACFAAGGHLLRDLGPTEKRVRCNIAMVREPGHPEPWTIAMPEPPSLHRAFDHGLRWGIEARVSDVKTRGFGLADSRSRIAARHDHLIPVMALVLNRAVSTGMSDAARNPTPAENKAPHRRPRNLARSLTSYFTRGIRALQACIQRLGLPPPLWNEWASLLGVRA